MDSTTQHPMPGSDSGSWVLGIEELGTVRLVDPTHQEFGSLVSVIAAGSRLTEDDHFDDGYELLCRMRDHYYLAHRVGPTEWQVAYCCSADYDGYSNDIEAVKRCLEMAETELFGPEEFDQWTERSEDTLADRQERREVWDEFVIDRTVVRAPGPDHDFFDGIMTLEEHATNAGSGPGPMTRVYSELIYRYRDHRFLVSGDPEGGGLDIGVIDERPGSLPEGWVHPSSLMVAVGGEPVSIAYDEDVDHDDQFGEMYWDEEDDEIEADPEVAADCTPRELQFHQAKLRARATLETLDVVHRGVELAGHNPSTTMPSGGAWCLFPTTASIVELDAKCGHVDPIDVYGETMAFTDGLALAAVVRLSTGDFFRLTAETIEYFDHDLQAFTGRRLRY